MTWLSAQIESLGSHSRSDFVGKKRVDFVATHDDASQSGLRAHIEQLDRKEPFRKYRFQYLDPEGNRQWMETSGFPRFAASGELLGYSGIGRNITKEIEKTKEAAKLRERLEIAIESMDEYFAICDADDRIITQNSRLMALNQPVAEYLEPGRSYEEFLQSRVGTRDFQGGNRA